MHMLLPKYHWQTKHHHHNFTGILFIAVVRSHVTSRNEYQRRLPRARKRHILIHVHIYIHTYIYIYIYTLFMCIYTYIYIYCTLYIVLYIYIHMQGSIRGSLLGSVGPPGDLFAKGITATFNGIVKACDQTIELNVSKDEICPAAPLSETKALRMIQDRSQPLRAALLYLLANQALFQEGGDAKIEAVAALFLACVEKYWSGVDSDNCPSLLESLVHWLSSGRLFFRR